MKYFEILSYVNTASKIIKEDMWDDEPMPDIPNPLPVPTPTQLAIILNTIDTIEDSYIDEEYQKRAGGKNNPQLWGQIARELRQTIGTIQTVPINNLIGIESKLYGAHLVKLAQGKIPTRGDKLPVVYVLKSGMYIGDGNHRVVNELSKGKTRVKALVIDFRQEEKELE